MENEVRQIPRYPNYWATRYGSILSRKRLRTKGGILRPTIETGGHLRLLVCEDGKKYHEFVHRLVLEAFVGPCPVGMECRHLNGNPSDNRLENLAWGTKSENAQDAVRHGTSAGFQLRGRVGLSGERNGQSKLMEEKVRVIRYLFKAAKFNQTELAWQFDVSKTTIRRVVIGERWGHV